MYWPPVTVKRGNYTVVKAVFFFPVKSGLISTDIFFFSFPWKAAKIVILGKWHDNKYIPAIVLQVLTIFQALNIVG